jgi:hypothetical protein
VDVHCGDAALALEMAGTHDGWMYQCIGPTTYSHIMYLHVVFSSSHPRLLVLCLSLYFDDHYSFYNFRFRHCNCTMPSPFTMIGSCSSEARGVCTENAQFHINLAKFGKTNLTDAGEKHLLQIHDKYDEIKTVHNPIFLYDINQLYDTNTDRKEQFKRDLEGYLGLNTPFPEAPLVGVYKKPKAISINICDDQFKPIRKELLDIGKRSSQWIRQYFLKAPRVYVSNREHFEEILSQWEKDPCVQTETLPQD